MSDDRLTAYDLSGADVREILDIARRQLAEVGTSDAMGFAETLLVYQVTLITADDRYSLEDTVAFLGVAVTAPEVLAGHAELPRDLVYAVSYPEDSYEWGKAFLLKILREVREVICNGGGNHKYIELQKQYQSYPKAFAVAASASIAGTLGVTQPWALGLATLVLLTLAQATKSAFCEMTDKQVIKEIEAQVVSARTARSARLKAVFGDIFEKPGDEDRKLGSRRTSTSPKQPTSRKRASRRPKAPPEES